MDTSLDNLAFSFCIYMLQGSDRVVSRGARFAPRGNVPGSRDVLLDILQCTELMSLFMPRSGRTSEGGGTRGRYYHPRHYFGGDYHYGAIVTILFCLSPLLPRYFSRRALHDRPILAVLAAVLPPVSPRTRITWSLFHVEIELPEASPSVCP